MQRLEPLLPERYYHIFNRGNNKENIFREPENYDYFMRLYLKYIHPVSDLFAYCLMPNHFHFALKLKNIQTFEDLKSSKVYNKFYSQRFSNFFNAYAKAFNKRYDRTGSLFQSRFRRKRVASDEYLVNLVHYIHRNPQEHGFVRDYRDYYYSSYHATLSRKKTNLARARVLDLFGDVHGFMEFSNRKHDFTDIRGLVEDDDF